MAATLTRPDAKAGAARSDAALPVRHRPAPPPKAHAPAPAKSPAMTPDNAVASLVEAGNEPGAAASRRAFVAHVQKTHGNRYAAQVVAEFRAQQQGEKPERPGTVASKTPAPEPVASAATTSAPVAAKPTPVSAPPEKSAHAHVAAPAPPAAKAPAAVEPPASARALPAARGGAAAGAPPAAPKAAPAAIGSAHAAAAPTAAPKEKTAAAEPSAAAVGPEGAAPAAAAATPAALAADPAFQAVIARARAVTEQQGHNSPAKRKAAEAQAAALGPPNEVASQAAAAQVGKMDAQQPQPFDRAGFKAALLAKITEITPKNLKEADEFKKSGGAGEVKSAVTSQVQAGKDTAQGGIKAATAEAPDQSAGQPKAVTPQPPTDAGARPADIGATAAAPKPKAESEVSLQAESQGLDHQMSGAGVTQKQLEQSNEPAFQGATQAKGEAQTNAQKAPEAYRQSEQGIIAGAKADAVSGASAQVQQMHGVRQAQFGLISGDQLATQQADKEARAEVSRRIEEIFQGTKTKVEERLARLDKEVNDTFDKGAEQARTAFETYVDDRMTSWKIDRYLATPGGSLLWIKDQFLGLPPEVNTFYTEGRAIYVQQMDAVIDQIATAVETGLNEAKQLISAGRAEVQTYVSGLPENLKQVGEQAATTIQGKFDSLKQSVDDKGNQLVDQLAQKYVENLGKLDERIGEMKAENRGLVAKAKEQIQGVIDTIIGLKNMLLGILAKAAAAIEKIIADPIGFLGNLVAGVKGGLNRFVSNIGAHLKKGLLDWLFGALGGAGITMPETFDLKGIIGLVLQVLGLTYANFRARAVAIIGEPIVKGLEEAAEVFKVVVTEGIPGLWRFIKEKLSDLKSMIMDAIFDFIRDRIIIAGITWLIGLLNPASAFVKACKAIYDVIMFFVNRGSQILALVNAVVDSVSAIANGAIDVASTWVENALAKAVPVAIGFMASLLGLGDPSAPVKKTIDKARSPVNAAMDWVIHQAVKLVKAAGKFIGGLFGGKKDNKEKSNDPEKAAKIEAGLAAIRREDQSLLKEGRITQEHAQGVATKVKGQHPVFTSLRVKDGGETWNYVYEASPAEEVTGEPKDGEDAPLYVSVKDQKPPGRSRVGKIDVNLPKFFDKLQGKTQTKLFEEKAIEGVEDATKLSAVKAPLAGGQITDPALLKQPKTSNVPGLWKEPDLVLLDPGKDGKGPQVEVFEVTLDADFKVARAKKPESDASHKRLQLAGSLITIAKLYPGVPIVYNIIVRGEAKDKVKTELEVELKNMRRQFAKEGIKNSIQIIWRST